MNHRVSIVYPVFSCFTLVNLFRTILNSKTQIKQNRLQPLVKFSKHFGESLKDYYDLYKNKTGFPECLRLVWGNGI